MGTLLIFKTNETLAFDPVRDITGETLSQFFESGDGPLSTTHIPSTSYFPSKGAMGTGWPDLQIMWASISFNKKTLGPLGEAFNIKSGHLLKYVEEMEEGEGSFGTFLLLGRPKSRGNVLLNASDPYGYPIIDPKYYSHPSDIKRIVEGLDDQNEFYHISMLIHDILNIFFL
jgi:choline dehydrogenase-like flavoprotein